MILTDTDIKKAVEAGKIAITGFDKTKVGSNSYDLHLSEHLLVYTDDELDSKTENVYERFTIPEEGYLLVPGQLYLGSTAERTSSLVHAPFIEGKSSVGRLGMAVHVTAGVGDIGFNGYWTLEITVVKPLRIYAGMPIAQIMFFLPLGVCATPYFMKPTAKYSNQDALPAPSMMWKNFTQ